MGAMVGDTVLLSEEERLRVLRRSKLLDSASERMFDAIVSRAAEICKTPIAVIALIDEHRQWFKAKVGLSGTETARDIAFCSHAIQQTGLMVVPDATNDQRFALNPLVTGEPNIRFYAGMPLITSGGAAFGTLCVIDKEPRELTSEQTIQLKILAESARILMEMRVSPLGQIFEQALAASVEGMTVADARQPGTPVIYANDAFYQLAGYQQEEVIGRNLKFLDGAATDLECIRKIENAIYKRERCVVDLIHYKKSGDPFWNRLSVIPLLDDNKELNYVVGLHSDITGVKDAEVARQQMLAMTTTMNTVNDIVLNFMNNLQLYRLFMEESWNVDTKLLKRFDTIFDDTAAKLSKINALTQFKSKNAARGLQVLDTE